MIFIVCFDLYFFPLPFHPPPLPSFSVFLLHLVNLTAGFSLFVYVAVFVNFFFLMLFDFVRAVTDAFLIDDVKRGRTCSNCNCNTKTEQNRANPE